MTELKGKYQVSLCRGQNCCPQLIVEGDKYTITDDFGGRVVLDKSNIDELITEYHRLTKTPEEIKCLLEARLKYLILSNIRDIIEGKQEGIVHTFQCSSDFFILGANKKKK